MNLNVIIISLYFLNIVADFYLISLFPEGFVLLWKKGDEILVVGEQIIKPENKRRFQLVKVI